MKEHADKTFVRQSQ